MDVWKIQLVLMAFCALMQTYQATLSSKVREERRLSSAWQVRCINVGGFNEKMCLNWWQLLSCLEASFKHSNDLELTRWSLFPCQDESVDAGLSHQLLGLMKRSKALRFYGLMGKRSGLQSSSCFFTAHKVVNNMNNICCRRKKAFPSAET